MRLFYGGEDGGGRVKETIGVPQGDISMRLFRVATTIKDQCC